MQTGEQSFVFPLYKYVEEFGQIRRVSNINEKYARILIGDYSGDDSDGKAKSEEVFAYVYAVLFAPWYRQKYKELLKIGYPRIPIPTSEEIFEKYVSAGNDLIAMHIMKQGSFKSKPHEYIIKDREVKKYKAEDGCLYINNDSYITGIGQDSWEMYIGGYQPMRKWLKERKGRILDDGALKHIANISDILDNTREIMDDLVAF